jgi:hypothetical protein
MPRKQSEIVQLKLRFPENLRLRIESAAERSLRSMNAEIVHRLEQSFEKESRIDLAQASATAALDKFMIVAQGKPVVLTPKGKTES